MDIMTILEYIGIFIASFSISFIFTYVLLSILD